MCNKEARAILSPGYRGMILSHPRVNSFNERKEQKLLLKYYVAEMKLKLGKQSKNLE